MRLPKDLLNGSYRRPRVFLCETDKTRICELETIDMSASFKFNTYSELTLTVSRIYTNMTTGETQVNPYYDKIEALRLIYLENFGYFEIQDPEIISDGIKEIKNITAYGLEYALSQKYLDGININTGEIDSTEVIEAAGGYIYPVTLYNPQKPNLSLLHIILEKVYGWSIGYIDESLKTMGRTFEISRVSVYDFIVQDICEKFNCFAVFDTISNKINLYSEALITKHIGDGITQSFACPYESIASVTIDSYRTVDYTYDVNNKYVIFNTAPEDGARIEITDGSQSEWITDVYVTFDNLAQEVNISYSADDIKTVLTVKGADDMNIREVNMGLPYIVDLSYYYSVDWMGQELYSVYTKYLQTYDSGQKKYAENSEQMLDLSGRITYEQQRLSLEYAIADNVTSTTQGTYYVRGGSDPNYYYTEVSLPDEYNANVDHYYTIDGTNLNEEKFSNLYAALQTYFTSQGQNDVSEIDELQSSFAFMNGKISISDLSSELSNATSLEQKKTAILEFFDEMWNQLGIVPLDSLYYKPYKKIETTNIEAGWNDTSNANYWKYYPVTLVLKSIEDEKNEREETIKIYQNQYDSLQEENQTITDNASMDVFFKKYFTDQGIDDVSAEKKAKQLLIRMSAFLREDEYTDDTFEELSTDTISSIMEKKQALLECGRVELEKLCEPKLEFSMDMANIYALPEFEPIIDQFQLGNLINVVIRSDYIKRARLLQVDINFDDFSDFSCSFGELTNLKTPSSIHADLLANALTAGKSVASSASYWNKSADIATQLDLKIQNGLISAIGGLYNEDQSVVIDDMGILLRKLNEDGSYSPYQAWIRNNTILLSEDGFSETSTPSLGLGEFVVDGETFYGILAKAILSGYIESSTIVGGTINIGNGTFMVDEFGNVTMGGNSKVGDIAIDDLQDYILNNDNIVYTICPMHGNYLADEIWVVGNDDYIQTDENGNIINSLGEIIAPISMGTISDDKTLVLDSEGNTIGGILDGVVFDANDNVIGVYDDGRNDAFSIVGYIQDGAAVDSNGDSIGTFSRYIVIADDGTLVGLIVGNYVVSSEIVGSADVNTVEPGSMLRSVNDGNGVYKSTDWVSALEKYDEQHSNLSNRVGSIEGDLDQHFEFSNDNGLVIKDGNSTIYTRLLNDRWAFMQKDDDPLVGDAEVTYISDKKLHISSAEITGLDGEDGNLDVNGPATVKELRVNNDDASNSLVIQSESNGSFSILVQTQGS